MQPLMIIQMISFIGGGGLAFWGVIKRKAKLFLIGGACMIPGVLIAPILWFI